MNCTSADEIPTVLRPRRRLLRPRQHGKSQAPGRLRIPSPRGQSPPRLQAELVLDYGSGRCGHPADGVLHAGERASGGGLFAVCVLQERRCFGNCQGAVEEFEEVYTELVDSARVLGRTRLRSI